MLQNVNSEICRFQLITPFADCTICIGLWNVVVQRSGDVRQISLLGATYVGLPYTIQTFFHERGMSASFPPQQIAHRKILPCPLCDSWVLNVDSHRTNEGSLSEMLSLIFDNTRRTAHRTYSFTIAILGSQLTTATLHSSQRFGARRKKIPESTKSSKLHNFIIGSLLSTTFCSKQDKLGTSSTALDICNPPTRYFHAKVIISLLFVVCMYFPTRFQAVKIINKQRQHTSMSKQSRNAAQVALPFPTQPHNHRVCTCARMVLNCTRSGKSHT